MLRVRLPQLFPVMSTWSLSTILSTRESNKSHVSRNAAGITHGRCSRPSGGVQLAPAPGPLEDHNSEAYVPSGEQVAPAPPLPIVDRQTDAADGPSPNGGRVSVGTIVGAAGGGVVFLILVLAGMLCPVGGIVGLNRLVEG